MEEKVGATAVVQDSTAEFLLEYYLMENEGLNYQFKIEKKENKLGNLVLCENYVSQYTIYNKDEANAVLEILAKNTVTPTTIDCVLHDLGYLPNTERI